MKGQKFKCIAPLETIDPSVSTAPFIAHPAPNVTVVSSAILSNDPLNVTLDPNFGLALSRF